MLPFTPPRGSFCLLGPRSSPHIARVRVFAGGLALLLLSSARWAVALQEAVLNDLMIGAIDRVFMQKDYLRLVMSYRALLVGDMGGGARLGSYGVGMMRNFS